MRLTVKLPAIVVGAILLTAVAGSVLSIVIGRHVLRQAVLDEGVQRVETYARAILFYIESARSVLIITAEMPLVKGLVRTREVAALVLANSNVFEYVMLLTPDGTVAMQEPRALEERLSHRNLSFNAWFGEVRRTDRTIVSDLHISPATQRPTIVIATPVRGADGRTLGIWAGALKLGKLSEIGSDASGRSVPVGWSYVTDRRGLIVAHQSKPNYVENQTDFSSVPSVSAALAGQQGSAEFFNAIENETKLTAYRPLPDLGWAVIYGIPTAIALSPLDALTRGILPASVALAALIGIGAFVSARRTVAPLVRLATAARTVGTGDFNQRIEVQSADEIGRLAEEFNRMADGLREKDVEVRRRTAEIIESEEQHRAVVDTAVDAIIVIDERGAILRFNPGAERMFAYSKAEVIGKNVSLLMSSPYREQHDGYLARFLATGEKRIIGIGREVVGRRKDGTEFPIYLAIAEMRLGESRMFTGIIRDITEVKRAAERQAHLVTSLDVANKELESFSYSVSHDLRAPLRHIEGFAQMLREECAPALNGSGQRYLGVITESVIQMGQLIDDLLRFSRMGRVEMHETQVSMDDLVSGVVKSLAGESLNRRIEWDIEPLPVVRGDRSMLRLVWVNLLSNSIKYTRPRALAKIRIGYSKATDEFCVQDNGAGFDMTYAAKLFGVFQRLHRAEEFEGTGVGLASVQRIITRHGGRIRAQGKVNEGATFHFSLPLHQGQPQ